MQEISETEFVGSASVLGGEATPQNIKSKDGTARSLGKWEITMHDCSLFQSRLLSPRGWQPEYCLLDSSSNLPEYKNCKKKKRKRKKKKKKEPCCPCLASSSSIISIVGGVPGLRGPAWLAELQRVHGAGQSHLQAHSGRLPPPGLRWQHPPCLWGRPLCSRCRCLSRRCLHRLQQQNKTQARLSAAPKMKHYSTIKPNCTTLNCCLQGST